ncbi:MAG: redoxin [Bacteroidetes bacterium GWE2_41_25]|nr:MAG: redoxin [Bacteroidetes bacterium GWA2_40_15]OFX91834.1 MAG: redoxin [Bacteroidetes bacterium GWE2_41_25]OFX94033.1 MAG: redoxin [Bacteroidetes bacterium GWC2_40_22]OFY57474.1 MAG: redoxin [Bacteroidetes bacterium GWF2_41_9]HAM10725.1 thioredoxin family protein [Bacteroidales bacterium]
MKKPVLFLAVVAISLQSFSGSPYKAGDYATDFNLKNLDGKMVSLSQYEDAKGFIVVFSCNVCPVVIKYEDRIKELHQEYSSKGYPVVAINSNDPSVSPGDSYEAMKKHAKNNGYKFEYLYDESQDVAKTYGATNTPHVYLLSKNAGKLKVEYVGAIDNNADNGAAADKKYVVDALNKLIKGEQPSVTATKAVGCGIKWKKA